MKVRSEVGNVKPTRFGVDAAFGAVAGGTGSAASTAWNGAAAEVGKHAGTQATAAGMATSGAFATGPAALADSRSFEK